VESNTGSDLMCTIRLHPDFVIAQFDNMCGSEDKSLAIQ